MSCCLLHQAYRCLVSSTHRSIAPRVFEQQSQWSLFLRAPCLIYLALNPKLGAVPGGCTLKVYSHKAVDRALRTAARMPNSEWWDKLVLYAEDEVEERNPAYWSDIDVQLQKLHHSLQIGKRQNV